MSFCVNCGVKLGESECDCPLCECPVVNPMEPELLPENFERPYPKRRDTLKNIVDRKFIISAISILYILPIILCLIIDIDLNSEITWSAISTVGIILCWTVIFLPFIVDKKFTSLCITIDSALIILLFYAIAWNTNAFNWILILAMPITAIIYIILILMIYFVKREILHDLYIGAFAFSAIGVFCIMTELLVWNYKRLHADIAHASSTGVLSWSVYVFIVCVIVAGLAFYIEKKKSVKRGLGKRFHI